MIKLLMGVYWFDEALQAALKSAGWPPVSRTQSLLFANIASGEHRATRLAENLGMRRQSMSQIIAELHERGLIEVTEDPQDRRARIINFSAQAEPLRFAAQTILAELERELQVRIGAPRMKTLKTALDDWGSPPIVRLVPAAPPHASATPSASKPRKR
jgi:DNA-binding MarR family transcriptional regulator